MTIPFPLSLALLADLLPITSVEWRWQHQQEYSGLGSGEILAAELGPSLLRADVSLAPMPHQQAADIEAVIDALDGSMRTFYLYDPRKKYPKSDPTGSILAASTVQINSLPSAISMSLKGLPAGFVLWRGDWLSFDYSSPARRAFHRISETVTANGSGVSPVFEVRPAIRTGAAVNNSVALIKPAAKMRLLPNSVQVSAEGMFTSIRFQAIQTP